ncbi:MAG: MBL fold metallo-hydrolase [Planctomycetes bacterium]|nr:MBL fold metallo-hydrolase [Planctomycetota bacterium]
MEGQDDLYIEQLLCGPMQNFVYIVGSKRTREVALVDPAWAIDPLLEHLDQKDLTLKAALVTHYHPDHVGGSMMGQDIEGLAALLERRGVKSYVNKHEADGVRKVTGLSESDLVRVDSEDTLQLGDVEVRFLHTPGHTPGSQCFLVSDALVSGDTLFIRSCGRVDLPGSDPTDLHHSLRRLAALPEQTVLYPGHNYSDEAQSTIGQELATNPYLRIPTEEMWRELMGY